MLPIATVSSGAAFAAGLGVIVLASTMIHRSRATTVLGFVLITVGLVISVVS
jgi:ABC-type transport system involved in cytochrome c biogenesis permease subunit